MAPQTGAVGGTIGEGQLRGHAKTGPSEDGTRHPRLSTGRGWVRWATLAQHRQGYPGILRVSYVMTATGGSRGARCFRDHAALPPELLAQPKCSRGHSHSDSWRLYHIQILATDLYLTSSTVTQHVSHSWLRRTRL